MTEGDVLAVIGRADQLYRARAWAEALALYETAQRLDPTQGTHQSLPLAIGHCRIELAADPAQLGPPAPATPMNSEREQLLTKILRARALELCRAGDTTRASELMRLVATCDASFAALYRDGFASGRSARSLAAPDDSDPPFLAAHGVTPARTAALKEHWRGKRLLMVHRRFFPEGGPRQGEPVNMIGLTAARFGLVTQEFKYTGDPAGLAPALLQSVLDGRPDLIFYDNRYLSNVPGDPEPAREQIENVFAMVRTQLGVRVVIGFMDAWQQMLVGAHELYRGVGTVFDLLQHCHPLALDAATPDQLARTFCHHIPTLIPAPSVPAGSVARACFVGSMSWFNDARVAWWAETARRGLPLDFHETLHVEGEPRSDQDYADLFARHQIGVNFTRRYGGPTIITGRTLDVPAVGGVLVEEDSFDTAYFLKPGVHYAPFTTIDDLTAQITALLADAPRRERMRAAGRQWIETYFRGEYFWAGLLGRLADLA